MIRRFVNRTLLDKWSWGVGIADFYSSIDRSVVRPRWLRSFLHGTWLGHLLVVLGAYVGGDLAFALGNMVDRHAWRPGGTKWAALDLAEVPDRQPTKAKAGAQALVLVRMGDTIAALHDTCSHAGCSLSEGTVVGDTIQCGCHGSRFKLSDGRVVVGPAVHDQPAYEVRRSDGKLEARRIR